MTRLQRLPLCCGAALVLTASGMVLAQSGSQQNETPVFRTQANLVLVDVVVTDKGKPVQGIAGSQFHVLEDGKEQKVSVFEEHRSTDAVEAGKPPANLPPNTYSNYPRYAVTSAANVLLLDALNTPLNDQVYVRRRMIQYLHTIPPGTRIAVFTLASRLRIVEGFTTDTSVIEKALTRGKGSPEQSPMLQPLFDDALVYLADMADGGNASSQAVQAMNQFAADTKSYQTDQRVTMTVDAMLQLTRYLSTIPGRKNVIWFTGSIPVNIAPDYTQMDPTSNMRDYAAGLKIVSAQMALSRVAIYPVDARGLMNLPSTTAEQQVLNPSLMNSTPDQAPMAVALPTAAQAVQQKDQSFLDNNYAEHATMEQLAFQTGGKAYYNTNAVGSALAQSIANGANYYTLGYQPDNRNYNGAYRKIQVQIGEGHYDLEYRRGYLADPPDQAAKMMAGQLSPLTAAMQHGVLPQSQVLFQVRVVPADDPVLKDQPASAGPAGAMTGTLKPPLSRYVADFTIDPGALEYRTLQDGRRHREVELTQVAYDSEGIRVNFNDGAFEVNRQGERDGATGEEVRLRQEIDLPSGALYLRVGVHDIISGRIGVLEIPLKVAKK